MRTFTFFPAQERGSGNCIQHPVPDKPLSRRRIPNVIRRPHEGFRHGRYRQGKAMCRHVRRITPWHGGKRSRSGFQSRSSIICGQILPPAYQQAERHGPAARAGRIERVKSRAGLNGTENGSATGCRTRNRNSTYSRQSWSVSQAITWFRTDCNTVFIGNIKPRAGGSSAINRQTEIQWRIFTGRPSVPSRAARNSR